MKKIISVVLTVLMCLALVSCGSTFDEKTDKAEKKDGYDVDLTKLSSTMVYAQVNDMVSASEKYLGKTVKMNGTFDYSEGDGRYYFTCIIADATACCAQGIEFVLSEKRSFPDGYPSLGDEITVTGVFDTYYEGDLMYCQLIDAELL